MSFIIIIYIFNNVPSLRDFKLPGLPYAGLLSPDET